MQETLLPTTEHELQSLSAEEPLTDQQLHDYRLRCGDYEYYKILSTERLLKELYHHCVETLQDEELMEVKDLRNFWIKRMSILVKVLYRREIKNEDT